MNIDKLETEYLNQNQIDEADVPQKERLIVLLMADKECGND